MPLLPSGIRRVMLVVLDGLRADAPARHRMPHLASLLEAGAWTLSGRTVRPSVTAAAMTSLFTGVSPEIHGLRSDRFALPRDPVRPLPALLRAHGLATHGFMARIPLVHRFVAARIAHRLGAATTFRGRSAAEILAAAQGTIARERTGLIVLHWPDADRAGHAAGWHSGAYAAAVSRLDQALGSLRALAGLDEDPGTMLWPAPTTAGVAGRQTTTTATTPTTPPFRSCWPAPGYGPGHWDRRASSTFPPPRSGPSACRSRATSEGGPDRGIPGASRASGGGLTRSWGSLTAARPRPRGARPAGGIFRQPPAARIPCPDAVPPAASSSPASLPPVPGP